MIAVVASLLLAVLSPVETGLSLAEMPLYKAALESRDPAPPFAVKFRELWDRPNEYRGRRVRIEGQIARQFHAPPAGELPARVELWLATASNDVICVVFPHGSPRAAEFPKDLRVAAEGTSFGLVRYLGGDVPRLAPLIVGSGDPVPISYPDAASATTSWRDVDWIVALVAAAIVTMLLARLHLRRPARSRIELGPAVEFQDVADEDGGPKSLIQSS